MAAPQTTPLLTTHRNAAPTMSLSPLPSSSAVGFGSSSDPNSSSSALPNPAANSDASPDQPLVAPTKPFSSTAAPSTLSGPTSSNASTDNSPNPFTTATSAPRPIPQSSSKTLRSELYSTSSPLPSSSNTPSSYCSSFQSPLDPVRRPTTDLTTPIPEECDEETCSESLPNDPVTPVSGRQSREFRFCDSHDLYHRDSVVNGGAAASYGIPEHPYDSLNQSNKDPVHVPFTPLTPPTLTKPAVTRLQTPKTPVSRADQDSASKKQAVTDQDQTPVPKRPVSRRSSSTLSRAMSSLFRRNTAHQDDNSAASSTSATPAFKEPSYNGGSSEIHLPVTSRIAASVNSGRRRFSYHRSVATTRSNTPPSPSSPAESAAGGGDKTNGTSMPTSHDFLENNAKKQRAHTGLSLRQRVNFVSSAKNHPPRRARSLERKKKTEEEHLTRQPWAIPPEAGTGMKARRLSLSLPDDFTVDVAELLKEFEYQHKFLGRHGKHLGKGATSKVTLMARKGCPGELYAVKEFRSKTSSETTEEYEKKIKSEYSIAKSLHHPNVVETIRLCTDHGRWNHVMEYCSEGDLFSLVSKKYLGEEGRDVDRLCIFKQLCQGINYLHSNGIAHRDIKLENLLITKDSKLKITDFGVSEVFSGIHPGLREAGGQCGLAMGEVRYCKPGICGSLPYIAPEVLSKKDEYDPRALDVWSSAIVMLYLIFSGNLWEKAEAGLSAPGQKNYNELVAGWVKMDAKKAAQPDMAKDAYPKVTAFEYCVKPIGLRRVLLNMLHPDPKKRITINNVVTDRWMKNVECCQLESYEDPVKFIDASKKDCMKCRTGKIYCHNHLPPASTGHGLPPMPGKPGY